MPAVVTTSKRGEPPWHCAALASVNEADANVWPVNPVMSAPAAALVAVGQFLARCSTPALYVAVGHPVLPGSKTPGSSAAEAVAASMSAITVTPKAICFFM